MKSVYNVKHFYHSPYSILPINPWSPFSLIKIPTIRIVACVWTLLPRSIDVHEKYRVRRLLPVVGSCSLRIFSRVFASHLDQCSSSHPFFQDAQFLSLKLQDAAIPFLSMQLSFPGHPYGLSCGRSNILKRLFDMTCATLVLTRPTCTHNQCILKCAFVKFVTWLFYVQDFSVDVIVQ